MELEEILSHLQKLYDNEKHSIRRRMHLEQAMKSLSDYQKLKREF